MGDERGDVPAAMRAWADEGWITDTDGRAVVCVGVDQFRAWIAEIARLRAALAAYAAPTNWRQIVRAWDRRPQDVWEGDGCEGWRLAADALDGATPAAATWQYPDPASAAWRAEYDAAMARRDWQTAAQMLDERAAREAGNAPD